VRPRGLLAWMGSSSRAGWVGDMGRSVGRSVSLSCVRLSDGGGDIAIEAEFPSGSSSSLRRWMSLTSGSKVTNQASIFHYIAWPTTSWAAVAGHIALDGSHFTSGGAFFKGDFVANNVGVGEVYRNRAV
jgi:hypothetical protein